MATKATVVESKEWYMAAYAPQGVPTNHHLRLRTVPLSLAADSIPDRHVAIETMLISVDPYLRTRMTGLQDGLYFPPFSLGQVIPAFGIGRVIHSKDDRYKENDIVLNAFFPIAEYCVIPADSLIRKIDPEAGISLTDYLSCLGVPGFAAWVGIEALADPKPDSNVFISAAAGGVGMFAGQLAKLRGCRVIGSTGSDDKVKLAKEKFGYDDVFNYNKETDFNAALSKYFPDGIDVYLDNVGGKMLEAVLNHVNTHARIPVCGMISQYNQIWTEREGVRNLLNIVGKEVRIEGYLIGSYLDRFADFSKEMESYLKQGKISSNNKIYCGIESFLESIGSLFSSSNDGKVIIQIKS
ncbi:ADH_zinc_N domain-containing protein [Cephalotus follicularis]|uniref:ADH_zinc_N domain-containing protein n=1 Tax=Cephalotus follicularis TaxID=3775 RepID=A0A1Q3BGT7_CEPFO|nr:ADH_zinc_N domain-containing protein [Cephalotus follicularis]